MTAETNAEAIERVNAEREYDRQIPCKRCEGRGWIRNRLDLKEMSHDEMARDSLASVHPIARDRSHSLRALDARPLPPSSTLALAGIPRPQTF